MTNELLKIVPSKLPKPANHQHGKSYFAKGDFYYYHYACDKANDIGWGCSYRSLQSMSSWILRTLKSYGKEVLAESQMSTTEVPTIRDIQQTLVDMNDKPAEFINSTEWIGALEVFYVVDSLYDITCRIQHIPSCYDFRKYSNIIKFYFQSVGGVIMMGGDTDTPSKCICGIHIVDNDAYWLIVDPHFIGVPDSVDDLIERGYIRWQRASDFVDSSFYNLCLPQLSFKSD